MHLCLRGLLALLLIWGTQAQGDAESIPGASSVLRIGLYDEAPFAYQGPAGAYRGFMVEIWEAIAAELDLSYEYRRTDLAGVLQGLESGDYDIGLGAISITPAREARIDFSQPVNPSGTAVVVPAKTLAGSFSTYIWPITKAIFVLAASLAALLLISGVLVWWVERRHPRDPGHRDIDSIEDGLWWSAVTISTIGYGDKVPQTRVGRFIGVVWIFAGLVMLSLFTANASAIFTVGQIDAQIQTREDLRKVDVGAATGSSGAEFLEREEIPFQGYASIEEALDAMLRGEVDCVVSNALVVQYLNNTRYDQRLAVSSRWLLRNNMGIALRSNSELRDPINQILLTLLATPEVQEATRRYFGER